MSPQDFTQRVEPIKDKLYRFAFRIMKNAMEAEDVVQEVLLKIWMKRHQMDQYINFEAWCMTLTKNLSLDKLRNKHRKTIDIPGNRDFIAGTTSPDHLTEVKDTFSHVQTIIERLPENQRLAVHLRDIEGLSYKEIADVMSNSMDQVKTNIFRARKKIREELLKKEEYGL